MPRSTMTPLVLLLAVVAAIAIAVPAHALFGGTFAANSCLAGKIKCVLKKKSCLHECHRKALRFGTAVATTCLDKCRDKFDEDPAVPGKGCFTRLEAKGGCGASVGDAATFEAKIDAHVIELMTQLNPAGGTPLNPCTAAKTKCITKYNACILNAVQKAMRKGTAIGDVSKCSALVDGGPTSCIGKLEAKYCDPLAVGCDPNAPQCLTFDDEVYLRQGDDAFIDDVVASLLVGPSAMNTQRCSGDTSVACTSAPGGVAGCGGGLGTCEFYFGAPLPYASGGITTCVTNQWNGTISGTFDQATGASAGVASVVVRVYNGITIDGPCPKCNFDALPNDGVQGGSCSGGTRNGLACDGGGISPDPNFGVTSLDCPPSGGLIATFPIDLTNTDTGTIAKTVGLGSPNCNGAPGKRCLCASCSLDFHVPCENDAQCATAGAGTCTNGAGEPRKPNPCIDSTIIGGDGTICLPGPNGEGSCPEDPITQHCRIDTFRGCTLDTDCPAPNDSCMSFPRECFAGYNGGIGDSVSAAGFTTEPRNGAAALQFAAVFCMAPTTSNSVNSVAGFPGPGRVELLGVGEDNGGPGCPTKASFLPTSKGAVIDVGWTGVAHDNRPIGQAKVTVAASCTGTHPNCVCSYTGPIAN